MSQWFGQRRVEQDHDTTEVKLAVGQWYIDNIAVTATATQINNGGVDGKTVRNGTGAPSAGLGAEGDFYIDTSVWTIYGPKTAGSWGSPTSLIGGGGAPTVTGITIGDVADDGSGYNSRVVTVQFDQMVYGFHVWASTDSDGQVPVSNSILQPPYGSAAPGKGIIFQAPVSLGGEDSSWVVYSGWADFSDYTFQVFFDDSSDLASGSPTGADVYLQIAMPDGVTRYTSSLITLPGA